MTTDIDIEKDDVSTKAVISKDGDGGDSGNGKNNVNSKKQKIIMNGNFFDYSYRFSINS